MDGLKIITAVIKDLLQNQYVVNALVENLRNKTFYKTKQQLIYLIAIQTVSY